MTDHAAVPGKVEANLIDLLQVVADNLRLLVFGPLFAGLVALGIAFLIPPTFTAKVQFIPPRLQPSSGAAAPSDLGMFWGVTSGFAGIRNPADQYVAFAKSRSVADGLIDQFKLMERYGRDFKEDTRKTLAANTNVTVGPKDGLIVIEVEDKDPKMAADITNAYVDELRKLLNRVALTEAQQRRVFFEKQVQETKANVVLAEQALKSSGVSGSALKTSTSAALEGVARLKAQISVQEVKLATMRGYLADSAPDFKQAQTELAALRSQFERADKDDGATAGQSDYVARFREFKYHEALLGLYLRQFEVARIDESRDGTLIQVVEVAQPPERKSHPKKALLAMLTTIVTGFVLLLFVFIRQGIRNARQNPALAGKITGLGSSLRRAFGIP